MKIIYTYECKTANFAPPAVSNRCGQKNHIRAKIGSIDRKPASRL